MTDGITVEVPEPGAPSSAATITLPTGISAVVRHGTGRDLRMAQMLIGQDASRFLYALIAQVTTIGGKRVTMESIDEMTIEDVIELQAEVNRVNFPTKAAPAPDTAAS